MWQRHHEGIGATIRGAAVTAVVALLLGGCGGSGGNGGTTSASSVPPPSAATTVPRTAGTEAPVVETEPSTALPETTAPAEPIDWANLTYDVGCGAVDSIELSDGLFQPEQFNSALESLIAELRSAVPIPTRANVTLVHIGCVAGGATGALSGELFVVMAAPAGSDTPVLLTAVIAEPGATHTVTDDGTVIIDDLTYGANDPNCCPSVFRSRQIVWDGASPVVVEGSRPDRDAGTAPTDPSGECVASEIDADHADTLAVSLLENALATAGFDPGSLDGVYDDALVNAVVRYIEFNADNPAIHSSGDAPYDNLHAEARVHGTVRTPILTSLGIACAQVAQLPRN